MTSYTLASPVEFKGTTYTTLTFRKMRTGDLVVADSFTGDITKTVAILSSITEVPIQAFKLIEIDDLNAILEAAAPFMGESAPAAGLTPSA